MEADNKEGIYVQGKRTIPESEFQSLCGLFCSAPMVKERNVGGSNWLAVHVQEEACARSEAAEGARVEKENKRRVREMKDLGTRCRKRIVCGRRNSKC